MVSACSGLVGVLVEVAFTSEVIRLVRTADRVPSSYTVAT
jgi:hypothetical protein